MSHRPTTRTSGRILNSVGETYRPETAQPPGPDFRYYDENEEDLITREPLGSRYRQPVVFYRNPLDHTAYRSTDWDSLQSIIKARTHDGYIREPETRGRYRGPLSSLDYDSAIPLIPFKECPPSLLAEQANAGPLLLKLGKPMPSGNMIHQLFNHLLFLIDTQNQTHSGRYSVYSELHDNDSTVFETEPMNRFENPPKTEFIDKPVLTFALRENNTRLAIALGQNTHRKEVYLHVIIRNAGTQTRTARAIPWSDIADYLQSGVLLFIIERILAVGY